MTHTFEIASKLCQVIIFIFIVKFPGIQNYFFVPIAVGQILLMVRFTIHVYFTEVKDKKADRLLNLILKRYALP